MKNIGCVQVLQILLVCSNVPYNIRNNLSQYLAPINETHLSFDFQFEDLACFDISSHFQTEASDMPCYLHLLQPELHEVFWGRSCSHSWEALFHHFQKGGS